MQKKGRTPIGRCLEGVTPYPWRRNYEGDLYGANGRPIYFQGPDAVIVEHSPEMAEALEAIRATAISRTPNPEAALNSIFHLADDLISRIRKTHRDHKWCRGTVR
jgi:hypothetical protein